MASIRSLPLSLAAASPSRGRLTDSRGRGAPGIGVTARPVLSTRRSSVAAAFRNEKSSWKHWCTPSDLITYQAVYIYLQQHSKRIGPMEAKLIKRETKVRVSSSQIPSKRFKWNKERTSFLTGYMTQHASDVKWKDAMFRDDALLKVAEAVSQRFQRECRVADVRRRLTSLKERWREIERIKGHGSASWDHATRTINMREDDYQRYAKLHPIDSGLINRPIEDYDELAFIFSDEKYPGNTQAEKDQNTNSVDNQMSQDPTEQQIKNENIRYLVLKIGELIDALKDLKPRDFADDLWKAVTACGYNERMAITAFEYFLKNEVEGKIFLVRSPELRKEWLAKFFSSLL